MAAIKGVTIDDMLSRGSIGDGDVLRLRSALYGAGSISADDVDALFALNTGCRDQARSWPDFFVEAITDFTVDQTEPEGYVTADNARWLIEHIGRDGKVCSRTELELVVTIIDRARWSPESLVSYALAQVRDAVVSGSGALRNGGEVKPGVITDGEVELVRRILYAFGGDGNIAVTRAEADMLFDINDATSPDTVTPTWTDLFVKAIANVVMATSHYAPPTREEALRREQWLDADATGGLSPLALLKGVMQLPSLLDSYRRMSREEAALERLERQRVEMIVNERITEGEAAWLVERLGRDGKLHPSEVALVAYLERESPAIHPDLRSLVERLSAAA
ncbi:MAG: hypothetical protein ACK4MF_07115 [Hyphomicrobiaceae bacterium]